MNEGYDNLINFTTIRYKNIIFDNNIIGGNIDKNYIKPFKKGITIYTKTHCPYCEKVIKLVKDNYKNVVFLDLEKINTKINTDIGSIYIYDVFENYIKDDLKKKEIFLDFINKYNKENNYNTHNTFPMVYVNGKLIGGCDDFIKYEEKKNLVGGYVNLKTNGKKYKIVKNQYGSGIIIGKWEGKIINSNNYINSKILQYYGVFKNDTNTKEGSYVGIYYKDNSNTNTFYGIYLNNENNKEYINDVIVSNCKWTDTHFEYGDFENNKLWLKNIISKFNISQPFNIKSYIEKMPKSEFHIHLEGLISKNIIDKMKNPKNITIGNKKLFDLFNKNFDILCSDYKHNIKVLLDHAILNMKNNNIFYTQFQYSALKVHDKTTLNIKSQFDIIIDHIESLDTANIIIDFILDIPRGNAKSYDYFYSGEYVKDIIDLSKMNKYKNYIRGVGIGGRIEANTISNSYKTHFDKILKNGLLIIPHAGEFNDKTTTCDSIKDALNYSSRLGHGVRISECGKIDNIKNNILDISITSNLNFIDDYNNNIDKHPIKELIKNNYNITLSTDDPGILYKHKIIDSGDDMLQNIDLNYEYRLLYSILDGTEKEKLDIITLISYNSIRNISFNNLNDDTCIKIKKIISNNLYMFIKNYFDLVEE